MEDFIDATSTTAMNSVPVQFLIYVMPQPICGLPATIVPLEGCLEVTVGVSINFNLSVINSCDPNAFEIADVVISSETIGVKVENLTESPSNSSLVSATLSWIPQANHIGPQQLCLIAYTE